MREIASDLRKSLRDGQQKLTYFLLSIETAVFAYIGKDFIAEPFGLTRNTFELLGLLAIASSIIAGVLALSAYVYVQKLNVEQLDLNTQIREFRLAAESGTPHINFLSGKVQEVDDLLAQADALIKEYQEIDTDMLDASRKTQLIGLTHTAFLVLGLALLMVSRSIGIFG